MGMCQLTKREKEVLDKLIGADVQTVAQDLGVRPSTIYVIRGRVRGKIEQCRDMLKMIKKYRKVLGVSTSVR